MEKTCVRLLAGQAVTVDGVEIELITVGVYNQGGGDPVESVELCVRSVAVPKFTADGGRETFPAERIPEPQPDAQEEVVPDEA